jgi:membrane protein involved in colicin uptake
MARSAEMAVCPPIRVGSSWVFPDGTVLPVVAGAADDGGDDGDAGDQTSGSGNDPKAELVAMRAALAKANREAAESRKKLKEIEDRDKSDSEKLSERLAAAERRAEEAEAKAMRVEVAAAKGLTPAQAKRLTGTTREELEADADDLLASFNPKGSDTTDGGQDRNEGGRPDVTGRPSEALRGGGDPSTTPDPDIRKIVAEIPRGGF